MDKINFIKFKRYWVLILKKQYETGTYRTRRELKDNIFKNINLTEEQKDEIWELIVEGV